jgi:hypothetical protein
LRALEVLSIAAFVAGLAVFASSVADWIVGRPWRRSRRKRLALDWRGESDAADWDQGRLEKSAAFTLSRYLSDPQVQEDFQKAIDEAPKKGRSSSLP